MMGQRFSFINHSVTYGLDTYYRTIMNDTTKWNKLLIFRIYVEDDNRIYCTFFPAKYFEHILSHLVAKNGSPSL